MGVCLWIEGRDNDEAILWTRRARALAPADEQPFAGMIRYTFHGLELLEKGRFNEAALFFHKAHSVNPELERVAGLGLLVSTGQGDATVALCRKVIAAQPEDPVVYLGLGWGLLAQGKFGEAPAAFRRGHELSLKSANPRTTASPRWLREAERLKVIDDNWPAFAAGKEKPQDRIDRRLLTVYCVLRKQYLAAARLHADGLRNDPQWADELAAEARYDAARFATLAAAGQGQDAAQLDEGERSRWRKQAVEWLHAELARWSKHLETASPLDRGVARDCLRWWQQEPDLAAIRDKDAVARLLADQQEACKSLWADVEALLNKAQEKPK